jgi:dihydroflavonol-4-reductase
MSTVLVTGGSGFVGSHLVLRLLQDGHKVRTTVRSRDREAEARAMLARGGIEAGERLEVLVADLERDEGWKVAAAGCEFVHHVASPLPFDNPRDVNALVGPARDGTLRVLRAARDVGAKRVVMTSSFAAIGYGHRPRKERLDETDWTDVNGPGVTAYIKSKAVAERAAWDFMAGEGGALELSTINPVGIFGPLLGPHLSSSVKVIKMMLDGGMPLVPRIYVSIVDVRDVADLHVRAMTNPAAKGERLLAVAEGPLPLLDIAAMLKRRLGSGARRISLVRFPDWGVRLVSIFNRNARAALPEMGFARRVTGDKAKRLLGWAPRGGEEALVATAESLLELGVVKAG